jgi:indolepyruvate ferredoxin oxidoreductase, beta subunit
MTKPQPKPIRLLIAALGGEGGGVLAGWITDAAIASGLHASRTSIPGVAQRTGATTYYIEMVAPNASARRPILALNPAPGQVDVFLVSELLEASRAVQSGFVTPGVTTVIGSTSRVFTVAEKSESGDGRIDPVRLEALVRQFAKRAVIADLAMEAQGAKSQVNAVLLGALAGTDLVPISADAFRAAIQRGGKAVTQNLAGFDAGFALAQNVGAISTGPVSPKLVERPVASSSEFPANAASLVAEGVARLTDYQSTAFAETYLAHLRRFNAMPYVDAALMASLARHLAIRMSVEDVIRVAQLKLRDSRIERVNAEARARPGDIVDITEYLKPGPEEILGLLPPKLANRALAFAARRQWMTKSWPLKVRTTRLSGFLRLKGLAALRNWRPGTHKFHEEQAWIGQWLTLVERVAKVDVSAAHEVSECARIVRGYGDTYKRGLQNYALIVSELVEPALAMPRGAPHLADALVQARLAAEKDPEGPTLTRTIDAVRASLQPPLRSLAAE